MVPKVGRGRMLIVLDRGDYWQTGLVFPKGQYQQLRAQGVEAIRQTIMEIEPRLARNSESLTDWQQISFLSVEASRCSRWYKPGLLPIGDAAHAMSPVAGVGINYAIQVLGRSDRVRGVAKGAPRTRRSFPPGSRAPHSAATAVGVTTRAKARGQAAEVSNGLTMI